MDLTLISFAFNPPATLPKEHVEPMSGSVSSVEWEEQSALQPQPSNEELPPAPKNDPDIGVPHANSARPPEIPVMPRASDQGEFAVEEVNEWLFGQQCSGKFPISNLQGRNAATYAPRRELRDVPMIGEGKYSGRMGIHLGGITDLRTSEEESAAIATSNNGDLCLGCGAAIAKAVVTAAGPGLQAELYNTYGAPERAEPTKYGQQHYSSCEGGRGYAVTCGPHDLRVTHGASAVEVLAIPMHDARGLENAYYEALVHSRTLDYIVLPMAGMSHPVLADRYEYDPATRRLKVTSCFELSAKIATNAVKTFIEHYPDSRLKVVFTIPKPEAEAYYRNCASDERYFHQLEAA